jgi:hypothetical protein
MLFGMGKLRSEMMKKHGKQSMKLLWKLETTQMSTNMLYLTVYSYIKCM